MDSEPLLPGMETAAASGSAENLWYTRLRMEADGLDYMYVKVSRIRSVVSLVLT